MSRSISLLLTLLFALPSMADERLAGIACRSVHLQYRAPKSRLFVNSVTVQKSAPGTYFCVCGFGKGYYGIQELANGKRLLIFSVWDPGKQNDPNSVETDRRVKLLYQDKKVRVGRFGNEGTGGQSFLDYPWKDNETYHLAVGAKVKGERTEYTSFFYLPESKQWKKLVTFSTLAGGRPVDGCYAFVEDFRRNRISATKPRQATFSNSWCLADGEWQPLATARFTADSNPAMTIDAGPSTQGFFLATGGETANKHAKLRAMMKTESASRPSAVIKALPLVADVREQP